MNERSVPRPLWLAGDGKVFAVGQHRILAHQELHREVVFVRPRGARDAPVQAPLTDVCVRSDCARLEAEGLAEAAPPP